MICCELNQPLETVWSSASRLGVWTIENDLSPYVLSFLGFTPLLYFQLAPSFQHTPPQVSLSLSDSLFHLLCPTSSILANIHSFDVFSHSSANSHPWELGDQVIIIALCLCPQCFVRVFFVFSQPFHDVVKVMAQDSVRQGLGHK